MQVNEIKHAANLEVWQRRIAECRSSGKPVRRWCAENGLSHSTYYSWEREIIGKASAGLVPKKNIELAELPVVHDSPALTSNDVIPAAIIRSGKLEISLTNEASATLIAALKELVLNA